MTTSRVPAPLVMGAVQTVISVASAAANEALGVDVAGVVGDRRGRGARGVQTPTSTTIRLPAVTLAVGVTVAVVAVRRALACCTNAGVVAALAAGVSPGRPNAKRPAATTTTSALENFR